MALMQSYVAGLIYHAAWGAVGLFVAMCLEADRFDVLYEVGIFTLFLLPVVWLFTAEPTHKFKGES